MATTVKDINHFHQNLEAAGNMWVMVEFFATWCGNCRSVTSKVAAIAEDYAQDLKVLLVDVDAFEELMQSYNVTGLPTFVFLKNGNPEHTVIGTNTKKLVTVIEQLFE